MIFFEELAYLPSDPLFDRLGSYDLTGGWIDEAQEAKKEAKDALQSRYSLLRGKNCDGTEWETTGRTLLTCNPKKNWIYTEFVKPQRDGVLPKDKIFIPALYSDNPFIDQKKYREGILSTKNKILVERLLYGNFDYDDNPEQMMQLDAINDLFTNTFVEKTGQRYISADIALQGADSFVVCVWHGLVLEKIYRIAKTTGAEVEAMIKGIAESERVPQSNIVYDGDGVGAFLGGYLKAARSFINNSAPLSGENYRNLKSQCAFKLAELVNKNEIYIFDDQYREMIIEEMEQIRQIDIDKDGKLAIEGKDKVKERLGRSPDIFDAIMVRMIFEIWKPQTETRSETKKALYSRETVF